METQEDLREEVRDLPPSVDRKHDRKGVREVRSGVEESLSLVKSFSDKLILLVVEFEDGLLKVTNTTVNEFGRFR